MDSTLLSYLRPLILVTRSPSRQGCTRLGGCSWSTSSNQIRHRQDFLQPDHAPHQHGRCLGVCAVCLGGTRPETPLWAGRALDNLHWFLTTEYGFGTIFCMRIYLFICTWRSSLEAPGFSESENSKCIWGRPWIWDARFLEFYQELKRSSFHQIAQSPPS